VQLLPLTGYSSLVARTPAELEDVLSRAARAVDGDVLGFLDSAADVAVAYCGRYYAAAASWLLYWPIMQLTKRRVAIAQLEDIIYHTLAYRDDVGAIVAFVEPGCENMLIRLGDAASHTGVPVVAIAPPLPPIIEDRFRGRDLVEVEDSPLVTGFTLIAAWLAARLVTAAGGIELRRKRYIEELKTLPSIVDELREKYGERLSRVAELTPTEIYATPTMFPAAYIARLYYELHRGRLVGVERVSSLLPLTASAIAREAGRGEVKLVALILASSVEADLLKEINYRVGLMKNISVETVTISTDPLTAPLYGILLISELLAT